ncbi:COMM domain-containing protein 1 [Entelurus aequoreus]|uniref:COMM domain-containing protein 1 n=1 Tax=Entelurus aequoreus TaxID=161455 RepID=UPI002B1DE4C5|nr:COMM domain-containing protein 1 [Entelurus aequoreus]
MAEAEASRSLLALLNGVAQQLYYGHSEVTEDLLHGQLFPHMTRDHFKAFYHKMRALLKSIATADMDHAQLEAFLTAQTRKQGAGGADPEQAAALARFWKSHRVRVRESLLSHSRWEPGLRGLSWRVDLQTAAGRGPLALMEMELGGSSGQDSQFVCVEMDEDKVHEVLKKMAEVQASIDAILQRT